MHFLPNITTLLRDFVLLEHTCNETPGGIGFVGVDRRGDLYAQEYDGGRKSFRRGARLKESRGGRIVNVITQNFFQDRPSHLVTSRRDGQFVNEIYDGAGLRMRLGSTTAAPFVVADPRNLQTLIVMPSGNKVHFCSIQNGRLVEETGLEMEGTLSPTHTSFFTGLCNDMRPNLVLNTVSGGRNCLEIHDFHSGSRRLVQRLYIPADVGPTLCFDSNGDQSYDLVYVSMEDGGAYLNIHRNLCVPELDKVGDSRPLEYLDAARSDTVYRDRPDHRFDLSRLLDGRVVTRNDDGMATGMFLADLDSDGRRHILLTVRHLGECRIRCLQFVDGELKVSRHNAGLSQYRNVLSVSVADMHDRGREDLVVNYVSNGEAVLVCEKIRAPAENCKLSALTVLEGRGRGSVHVPGITYLVLYDNARKWRRVSQLAATSYPSFQHQGAYVGLGQTNFFITFVLARTNCLSGKWGGYSVGNVIVPNTSIVFIVSRNKWTVQNFFLLNKYMTIITSLVAFMAVNLLVLLFLTVRERRGLTEKEAAGVMRPVFSAL